MVTYLKEHDVYKSFLVGGHLVSRSNTGGAGLKKDRVQGSADDDKSHSISKFSSYSGSDPVQRLIACQNGRKCKTKSRIATAIRRSRKR